MPAVTTAAPSGAIAARLGAAPSRARAARSSPRAHPRSSVVASASSGSDEDPRAPAPARLTRRAAAVSFAAAAAAALAGVPARPALAAPSVEGGNFGNALLERRRVEEGAARANLDSIMADIREEEAKLKALRFEREAESARAINAVREAEEQKARQQVVDGKTLCITPFGVDVVGISETVALVGAVGAGLTSNARKAEIAELNEKLRAVNQTLRAQIRAPAPTNAGNVVHPDGGVSVDRRPMDSMDLDDEAARSAHAEAAAAAGGGADGAVAEFPEESESVATMKSALREGRALLKEETTEAYRAAREKFEKALMLSRMVGDQVQVRRAVRGLSASERGLGRGKEAIAYLKEVLEISKQMGDFTGDTDALGAIADIYTESGDLENAGKYYDLYLDALNDELNV